MTYRRVKTLSVLLICGLTTTGCGNYLGGVTVSGRTGLTMSSTGDLLIRVQPCGLAIDVVDVSGPFSQDQYPPQPNPVYLQVRDSAGRSEPFTIDPKNIEPSWDIEANNGIPTHPDAMIIINSRIEGQNSQTSQVSAYLRDLQNLTEGQIYVGNASMNPQIIDDSTFLTCR